jgi:hypothetical protein
MNTRVAFVVAVIFQAAMATGHGESASPNVPGVVIDHIPAATDVYIGSPSVSEIQGAFWPSLFVHRGAWDTT